MPYRHAGEEGKIRTGKLNEDEEVEEVVGNHCLT
jgi:hypothetical protein